MQLRLDFKQVDEKKVREILTNEDYHPLIEVTKKNKFTEENICHLACKNGHIKILSLMLQHLDCQKGFKAQDFNGNFPIHSLTLNVVSTENDFKQILELLMIKPPNEGDSVYKVQS